LGLGGYGIATVRGKINPTDSVIPTFSAGIKQRAGLEQPKYCRYCFPNQREKIFIYHTTHEISPSLLKKPARNDGLVESATNFVIPVFPRQKTLMSDGNI